MIKSKKTKKGIGMKIAGDLEKLPFVEIPVPEKVTIFLKQHSGPECAPCVKAGDRVKTGQVIGTSEDFFAVDVHSSVTGTVENIISTENPYGGFGQAIVIVPEKKDEWDNSAADKDFLKKSPAEIAARFKSAGITMTEMEPLPLHAVIDLKSDSMRLIAEAEAAERVAEAEKAAAEALAKGEPMPERPAEPEKIEFEKLPAINTIIINTLDNEPEMAVNQRLFLDHGGSVKDIAALFSHVTGCAEVIFAVAAPHAGFAEKVLGESKSVAIVSDKYPATLPRMIIRSVTKKTLPAGMPPRLAGILYVPFETALAALEAVAAGKNNVMESLTISGDAMTPPTNVQTRIGTPARTVLAFCGLREAQLGKLVFGGPFKGKAQFSLDMPVVKGMNGMVAQTAAGLSHVEPQHCINCGACVDVCPVNLQPNLLSRFCEFFQYDSPAFMKEIPACIDCGMCGFVCPAHRPMMQYFSNGKHFLGISSKGM